MRKNLVLAFTCFLILGCSNKTQLSTKITRNDGACKLDIKIKGSLQNPAWSPDGNCLLFTRFRDGYNKQLSDLFIYNLANLLARVLVSNNEGNVNLPGSAWNPVNNTIAFSSSREPHDEIYVIKADSYSGSEKKVTSRKDEAAYEPSLSPDGQWVVFETHKVDVEEGGIITKSKIDGTSDYNVLTNKNEDCRQPNWSPVGNLICYQKFNGSQWDVWVMKPDGSNKKQITEGSGDKTDASFSPDGKWIVYSSDEGGLKFANLFIVSVSGGKSRRITRFSGYDGAPSWDKHGIVFESCKGEPGNSQGTSLWIIKSPASLKFEAYGL